MYGRHDRAKMDILVTSKHRAVPCTEWSKATSRATPIVGVGAPPQCGIPLDVVPVERHRPAVHFSKQLARQPIRPLFADVDETPTKHNLDAVSTHPRSTVCVIDMKRGMGRSDLKDIRETASQASPSPSPPASPKPKRKQRIHLRYSYDNALAAVRPSSRCVQMRSMLGREGDTKQAARGVDHSPSHHASSTHRRTLGGDFSKAQGRWLDVKKGHDGHDIKWGGVDKHIKGVSFKGTRKRPESSSWYLDHYGPVAPLCTRWNGVNVHAWHDQAYGVVKSRPPSVAAARSIGTDTDSVIKSAGAQLNMVRSILMRHSKEGERKKKERIATYQSDSRMSNRELSPMFAMSYQSPTATAP
eukprot:TRINITY_DN24298_c0_g1_i1.p1 TRINITY_DN24298_c0_g1~~TRINITY_DN24298_c0_g1_i1.p1  ORF type:complete len:357 (+),score=49.96 TRINITY_DN24298_c0_g1_i1:43-1113(+)